MTTPQPVDPRSWEELSSEEQDETIDKAVDFDSYQIRLETGTAGTTPPAV